MKHCLPVKALNAGNRYASEAPMLLMDDLSRNEIQLILPKILILETSQVGYDHLSS